MASNLTIQKQDITKMAVDCIVNAANAHLQHGGGVCGAIFAAAGAAQLQAACDLHGHCPTGKAVITPICPAVPACSRRRISSRWGQKPHPIFRDGGICSSVPNPGWK